MRIELRGLTKAFDSANAVDGIDLAINDAEFVAFLGPSGCGKTTTLLMIAGIYRPTGGEIVFDGAVVNRLPPKQRNLGMVFQSYALYPHMSAFENMTFPLRLKKVPMEQRRESAQRVGEMMGISELLHRKPGQLSGGQQQRVALGRALVKEPDALLFDEPLSNLDARLRITMRTEIKRLQKQLGITSIYVTHDQVEAMTMAERVAIMNAGRLESFLSPDDTYARPPSRFVAGFVGNPPMEFFDVEIGEEAGIFHAKRPGVSVVVAADRGAKAAAHRGTVTLGIRPEDIAVGAGESRGEVVAVEPLGREDLVDIEVEGLLLRALASAAVRPKLGENVNFRIDPEKVQFFDPDTKQSLLWEHQG
ncbi:MAG: ABC transporter ATP-binding protein [Acidimicrobiales bacterium]